MDNCVAFAFLGLTLGFTGTLLTALDSIAV